METAELSRLKIGITYRCNAACTHCGVSGRIRCDVPELDLAELERIAVEGRLAGVSSIVLFGGEPTVRDDVTDIIRTLSAHIPTVLMDSNGLRVDEALARDMKEAGLTQIQISLHGEDAATHHRLSGQDSFARVTDAVRCSVAAGLDTHVSVVVTHESLASGSLPRVITLARELGAGGVRVLLPKVSGEWSEADSVLLSQEELAALAVIADGTFAYVEGEGRSECVCGAIHEGLFYISAYGAVQPCHFIPVHLGNVQTEPLVDISRKGSRDLPMLARETFFARGCPVAHPEAIELFGRAAGSLLPSNTQNYVDLGGERGGATAAAPAPADRVPDPRPRRATADIVSALEAVSETHDHVHLGGGDLPARPDYTALAETLERLSLTVTVTCDPRGLTGALLDRVTIRRVVIPLSAGARPGLTRGSLGELARGVDELRRREIPFEFQAYGDEPVDVCLLRALASLYPQQVTSLVLAPRTESSGSAVEQAHWPPWLAEETITRRRLLFYNGRAVDPEAALDGDDLSYAAGHTAVARVNAALVAKTGGELLLTLDRDDLLRQAEALAALVPLAAELGLRIVLRRAGREDHDAQQLWQHHRALLQEESLDRIAALWTARARHPDTLTMLGWGTVLTRPWTRLDQLQQTLQIRDSQKHTVPDERWEVLLRDALLWDTDPPHIDGLPSAREDVPRWAWGGFPRPGRGWQFTDERTELAHRLLLVTALQLTNADPGPLRDGWEFATMDRLLERLPPERRTLAALAGPLIDAASAHSPDSAFEGKLERALGLEASNPEPEEEPPSADEQTLLDAAPTLVAAIERLLARPDFPLHGSALVASTPRHTPGLHWLELRFESPDQELTASLHPAASQVPGLHEGARLHIVHRCEAERSGGRWEERAIRSLGAVLELTLSGLDIQATEERWRSGLADQFADTDTPTPIEPTALSPAARRLHAHGPLLRRIAEGLAAAPRSPLRGWHLSALVPRVEEGEYAVDLTLQRGEEHLSLTLLPGDSPRPAYAEASTVKLLHAPQTPPPADVGRRGLVGFCKLVDHYLRRYEPSPSEDRGE